MLARAFWHAYELRKKNESCQKIYEQVKSSFTSFVMFLL